MRPRRIWLWISIVYTVAATALSISLAALSAFADLQSDDLPTEYGPGGPAIIARYDFEQSFVWAALSFAVAYGVLALFFAALKQASRHAAGSNLKSDVAAKARLIWLASWPRHRLH